MYLLIKIALIVGVLVVLAVLSLVAKIAGMLRGAGKEFANAAPEPCRVNLEPEPNSQWLKPEIVKRYAADLRALGFEEVGAFSIPEMGGLMIVGLVHPVEGLLSVVYDHNRAPAPTFDICADYADGSTVSATNSSIGGTLDKRPNHPVLWLGDVSASEVLEAVRKHPASAPRQPIAKEDFVAHFKLAYAQSVNWRLKKGGASREEIRRQAEKKGHQFTDEQIEESYRSLRQKYLQRLQAGCVAQYQDDQKPSAAEWERIRPQTFAIAETLEMNEIVEAVSSQLHLDVEQRHQLEKVEKTFGESAVDCMTRILKADIAGLGLEKLGEVTEPVRALILRAPDRSAQAALVRPLKVAL